MLEGSTINKMLAEEQEYLIGLTLQTTFIDKVDSLFLQLQNQLVKRKENYASLHILSILVTCLTKYNSIKKNQTAHY